MKKVLSFLAVAVVLCAACGREGPRAQESLTPGTSSVPSASAMTDTSAAPTTSAGTTAKPSSTEATPKPTAAATSAPVTKPAEGRANAPKDGTYVYAYTGAASDPFNPAAPPQKFSGDQTLVLSHSGTTYTAEQTNSEQAGRTTTRTRWTSTKVEFLELKTESQAGTFQCTFNPPLVITKFPIKPETFPTQQLKGTGNACNGSLDITIVKKENVKDGAGHTWSTWQVKVKTTIKAGQLTLTQNETRNISPDLGVEIRTDSVSNGQYATQKFTTTATSVLKKHP